MPGPVIDIEVDGKGGGGGSRQRLGCGGIVLGLFLLLWMFLGLCPLG